MSVALISMNIWPGDNIGQFQYLNLLSAILYNYVGMFRLIIILTYAYTLVSVINNI